MRTRVIRNIFSYTWWRDLLAKRLWPSKTVALAVVGDTGCGKTSLVFRFTRDRLPCESETITTLDTDYIDITRDKQQIRLTLHDTSGSEEMSRVRGLTYAQVDGIILCFPLDSHSSLRRVESDWAPEVRLLCKGKPCVLVGTKKDLRDGANCALSDRAKDYVTRREGKQLAKTIGAVAYFECSALDGQDCGKTVKRIFGRSLRESLRR